MQTIHEIVNNNSDNVGADDDELDEADAYPYCCGESKQFNTPKLNFIKL